MNELEHKKQMLIQQITDHREHMRLELETLKSANPVLPMIRSGHELLGKLRPGRESDGGRSVSQLHVELASTVLPVVLQVLRAVLRRRSEKRASERNS